MKPTAREKLLERSLLEAIKALQMYGNPDSYYAIAFLYDPPCGEFRDDFSNVDKSWQYNRKMPGKLARKTLDKIAKRLSDPQPHSRSNRSKNDSSRHTD